MKDARVLTVVAAAALFASSCCVTVPLSIASDFARARACPVDYSDPNLTPSSSYPVHIDVVTPSGVRIDSSGFPVDVADVDARVAQLEKCLGVTVSRCGFLVKIAPDQVTHPDGSHSLPNWPAGWTCRGQVQAPNVAVVTSDRWALPHELIHIVFHLSNAEHSDPRFLCQ